ncbi:uncharacterized protein LOC133306549 [Gastrolobium bilobum]|uniref:uncharacterized protein LOC133306549 n=1 Tax=Gastrolobium bilobum TaxID=150636 RepID=UPI002AB15799|nr:uncharacterized protein LOC133306549 [Gastrolobium bilobum]
MDPETHSHVVGHSAARLLSSNSMYAMMLFLNFGFGKRECRARSYFFLEEAEEIAEKLRESVAASLQGKKLASFTRISSTVHDDEPLIRALSKLIYLNNPDLVLFVGEALGIGVLIEPIYFVAEVTDLSTSPTPRLIDGILLTKFDIIDDKVGAALSMVYISGAPVRFLYIFSVKHVAKDGASCGQ